MQWPETEVMWIWRNLPGKTREITSSELHFRRVSAVWNHCAPCNLAMQGVEFLPKLCPRFAMVIQLITLVILLGGYEALQTTKWDGDPSDHCSIQIFDSHYFKVRKASWMISLSTYGKHMAPNDILNSLSLLLCLCEIPHVLGVLTSHGAYPFFSNMSSVWNSII